MKFPNSPAVLSLLFLSSVTGVFSSPIPVEFHLDPKSGISRDHEGMLQYFKDRINKRYVPAMREAVGKRKSDPKAQRALLLAFGHDYEAQVSTIRTNLARLSNYNAAILRLDSDTLKHPSAYYPHEKDIGISDKLFMFRFKTPPNGAHPEELEEVEKVAALVLIHELSHAAFGAVDRYRSDLTPVTAAEHGHKPDDALGYLLGDFKRLRAKAGAALMVKNADSYLLFAHLAVNGDVDISPLYPKSLWDA